MARPAPLARIATVLALAAALCIPAAATSAAPPAPAAIAAPQPGYAGVVFRGAPEGLVLLDEQEDGVRIALALAELPGAAVRLVAATALCGQVGGTSVGLGLVLHARDRFAAVWVTGRTDSVDAIGSLRLVARGEQIACANTIHGDEQIDVCIAVPDACYGLMALPEQLDGKVIRGVVVRVTQREGGLVRMVVGRATPRVGFVIVGDAPCSAGGGEPLARVRLPDGVGLHTRTLPIETPAEIGSFWFAVGTLAPFCVDAELNALVWQP